MFRLTIAAVAFVILFSVVGAKPPGRRVDPEPKATPKAFVPPNLNGQTNWGLIFQEEGSREFAFSGHPEWEGTGHFRKSDNRVVVQWKNLRTGETGPGLYDLAVDEFGNPELRGQWGYSPHASIDDAGNIVGTLSSDRAYRVAPPDPEI